MAIRTRMSRRQSCECSMPSRRALATFEDLVRVREDVRAVDDRLVHAILLELVAPSARNPRQHLDGIDELAASLAVHGLLQPIVVRRCGTGYQLVAGHRRYAAARQLGWADIPAVIRDETDENAYILTLVENLQREDLSPKEEAAALEVLVRERGWSTRQVGEAVKRSHMYVSKRLRVFEDAALAAPVLSDKLPVSTAEELLRIDDAAARREIVDRAIAEQWGQSRARREVREWKVTFQPASSDQRSARVLELVERLRQVLAAGPVADLTAPARRALQQASRELRVIASN
jgi:ParB family transcriptional regulator, chromosome partitioning protein